MQINCNWFFDLDIQIIIIIYVLVIQLKVQLFHYWCVSLYVYSKHIQQSKIDSNTRQLSETNLLYIHITHLTLTADLITITIKTAAWQHQYWKRFDVSTRPDIIRIPFVLRLYMCFIRRHIYSIRYIVAGTSCVFVTSDLYFCSTCERLLLSRALTFVDTSSNVVEIQSKDTRR